MTDSGSPPSRTEVDDLGTLRRRRWPVREALEGAYLATVVVLAALAFSHPNHVVPWAYAGALILCLPALLLLLPVLYIVAAVSWNITGADHGGPTLPVTAAYVSTLAVAAGANIAFVRYSLRYRHRSLLWRALCIVVMVFGIVQIVAGQSSPESSPWLIPLGVSTFALALAAHFVAVWFAATRRRRASAGPRPN